MRILVDGRWMSAPLRGMGRFARQLIQPLLGTNQLLVLLPKGSVHNYASSAMYRRPVAFPLWEQLTLPSAAARAKADYILCPYNTGPFYRSKEQKVLLVVHDLIYLESYRRLALSRSLYQSLGRVYRRVVMPPVLREAFRIVTVSHFTKHQIIRRFRLSEEQISVIPNSLSNDLLMHPPSLLDRNAAIYLAVTGDAPSKNLAALLEAFRIAVDELPRGSCLWVVGVPKERQRPWIERVAALGIATNVVFLGTLTDRELMGLYDRAGSLVFPSLMEGFGIPLIEAMARRLPIAASNATAIPEVVGDAAVLFDPQDAMSIAAAIVKVGNDRVLREQLARCSDVRVHTFSHEATGPLVKNFWAQLGVPC